MGHQFDVISIVLADGLEVVAEQLRVCEMLFEQGQPAGHGMATDIDNPRVGQDQVDEAYVRGIVRHFVDEPWPTQYSMHAGLAEVSLAMRAQCPAVQRAEDLRISCFIRTALRVIQRLRNRCDVR